MTKTRPCRRGDEDSPCPYPALAGKQACYWHALAKQPTEVQIRVAQNRLAAAPLPHRPRVSKDAWPVGHRWCSGCQHMVPTWYTSGSRCTACSSAADHAGYLARTYSVLDPQSGALRPMSAEDYAALWSSQGGRCAICGRREGKRRFATDHDHRTGAVRGLVCSDPEYGCNLKVLARFDGDDDPVAMAERLVEYLREPFMTRVLAGRPAAPRPAPRRKVVSTYVDDGSPIPF